MPDKEGPNASLMGPQTLAQMAHEAPTTSAARLFCWKLVAFLTHSGTTCP